VDGGGDLPGFCAPMCSKADGLQCQRDDHVCLGLGTFGGCFSRDAIECDRGARTGCQPAATCVRVGFEDPDLGRCETTCDPMEPHCPDGRGCYFIRTYSSAFCGLPGTGAAEEPCACDKCCEPGLACTPDLDGSGRHRRYERPRKRPRPRCRTAARRRPIQSPRARRVSSTARRECGESC
jgi:hypothetical protein